MQWEFSAYGAANTVRLHLRVVSFELFYIYRNYFLYGSHAWAHFRQGIVTLRSAQR